MKMSSLQLDKKRMKITNICKFCGKEFYPNYSGTGLYCSVECYHNDISGKEINKEERSGKRCLAGFD
jgi:hypothetical protein